MARSTLSAWQTRLFDRGVVYFNLRAYFEAHEDWEVLWHDAAGSHRDALQGLIQVAAAFVHVERGFFARGFAQLLRVGFERMKGSGVEVGGLDLARFERALAPWLRHAAEVRGGAELRPASAPPPRLHYLPGVVPDPLLPDESAGPVDE